MYCIKNNITDIYININQTIYNFTDKIFYAKLIFVVKPKILDDILRFVGRPNDSVDISIPFYSYPSPSTLEIKSQDGTPVVNDSRHSVTYMPEKVSTEFYGTTVKLDGQIAILSITDIKEEEFMTYKLELTNDIGTTEAIFVLGMESKYN